jgi:hypothetical protein
MDDKIPCCALDATRKVRKLNIGGQSIGISQLDPVIKEVQTLKLENENMIKDELLKRIKIYNYVPPTGEEEYKHAIFEEYKKAEVNNRG